jgi:very-short-patch-repair endonuclease
MGFASVASTADAARTDWLEARGYLVIRFWNNDVLSNTEGMLVRILEALRADPPPYPPPQGGRGFGAWGE